MKITYRRVKKLFVFILEAVLLVVLYPIGKVLYGKKDVFLFSERGYEARDNGRYMFDYFRRNHPEISAYYVIDFKSEDIDQVRQLGNLVHYKSLRHRILFFGAQYCISTHIYGYTPNIDFYTRLFRRGWFADKKAVSLRHGITKDDLPQIYKNNIKIDMMVTGARPEYEYMLSQFGYTEETLKYTGFARFDGLHDVRTENQILIMPTWRNYLYMLSQKEFLETEYYKCWSSVLADPALAAALEEKGIRLVFYPHFELQKYVHLFRASSENIIIADKEHYDVQTLLKESKLLVTDFSSVFFDFAYMLKPCLYYQFDKEKFFGNHYRKGYFGYEEMGFGEVTETHEVFMETLLQYINMNMEMEEEYKTRAVSFFDIRDTRNCERIYHEIMKLRDTDGQT